MDGANQPHPAGRRHNILHRLMDRRGIAAVEFAFVAPLFLLLVFGIIIYGFYFATYIAVAHAAAEGARASVAGLTEAERRLFAVNQVDAVFARYAPLLSSDDAHLAVDASQLDARNFKVTVSYDLADRHFSLFAPLLPLPSEKPAVSVVIADGGF